jgi:hypothetical protein
MLNLSDAAKRVGFRARRRGLGTAWRRPPQYIGAPLDFFTIMLRVRRRAAAEIRLDKNLAWD